MILNIRRISLFAILSIGLFTISFAQSNCNAGEKEIIVNFNADPFPWENSYVLISQNGTTLLEGGFFLVPDSLYSDTLCVPADECLSFIFQDFAMDGLQTGGSIKIYIDGVLVLDDPELTGRYFYEYLDCNSGSICDKATDIDLGTYQIDDQYATQWYRFRPATSGIYKISTCFPENTCNTTIWGYDFCNPINESPNTQGAIFFNEDKCGDQAELTVNLIGDNSYYLKIGSSNIDCDKGDIKWSLSFEGAVTGCTDSLACNFDPVATIDNGTCKFNGDPACPTAPDLSISQITFERSMRRAIVNNQNSCFREEGCLRGYGPRTVIRFDTKFENIGDKDYYIGVPPANTNQSTTQWEFDECHQHWHYEGYARYILFDQQGNEIPIGFKNGFCVIDLECPPNIQSKYTCAQQGLTAGCADIYDHFLDCQWIDITDLDDGIYTFVAVVNWDHSPDAYGNFESDYSNNWAQVCLEVFTDTAFNYTGYQLVNDCPGYVDCLGIPNGTAQKDCLGNCNGSRLMGDVNIDNARDLADVMDYVQQSLADSNDATQCNDLNADGAINVVDAALSLECALHAGQAPLPGHGHSPCEFPFGIYNQMDSVWLGIGEINPTDGYVDVMYRSPYGRIEGFEFKLSGLTMESSQLLIPSFNATVFNNEVELIGLSYEETSLNKSITWEPFLRVFVKEFLSDTICISEVTAIVNENLETMNLVATECNIGDVSSVNTKIINQFYSAVIPNPFSEKANLIFENANNEVVQISIFDLSGKKIYEEKNIRNKSVEISKSQLSEGLLIYRLVKGAQISTGKFIVE